MRKVFHKEEAAPAKIQESYGQNSVWSVSLTAPRGPKKRNDIRAVAGAREETAERCSGAPAARRCWAGLEGF